MSQPPASRFQRVVRALVSGRFRHVGVFLIFLAIWEGAVSLAGSPRSVPAPSAVVSAIGPMLTSGELIQHTLVSLRRYLIGYGLASVLGVALGVGMALSPYLRIGLQPVLETIRPVPPLALLPILLALIGIGEPLILLIVINAAFFPVLLNSYGGVRDVERVYVHAADTLGAPRKTTTRRVILPAALPQIFVGFRVGAQFGWMSIVAAELIGANKGLGFLIMWYQQFLSVGEVVVGLVAIGVLGFVFDRAIVYLSRRMCRWATV